MDCNKITFLYLSCKVKLLLHRVFKVSFLLGTRTVNRSKRVWNLTKVICYSIVYLPSIYRYMFLNIQLAVHAKPSKSSWWRRGDLYTTVFTKSNQATLLVKFPLIATWPATMAPDGHFSCLLTWTHGQRRTYTYVTKGNRPWRTITPSWNMGTPSNKAIWLADRHLSTSWKRIREVCQDFIHNILSIN